MFKTLLLLLAGLMPVLCAAEFRDPTQPAYPLPSTTAATAAADTNLVLSAIWISTQFRRATINGILVQQGQTIDLNQASGVNATSATATDTVPTAQISSVSNSIKVISISSNSVIIDHNGERKTLHLLQRPYKSQPKH